MMDVGVVELLVLVLPLGVLSAAVLYWIIRLAVRHGTLDAYRIDRVDQRIERMQGAEGGRPEAAGGVVPE
jgi:hypothetical protein